MKILCFGTKLVENDDAALKVCELLKNDFAHAEFIACDDPSEIIEHADGAIILDVVKGIDRVQFIDDDLLKERDLYTLHDFDLGFFIRLWRSIGGPKTKILGLPYGKPAQSLLADVKQILNELYLKEVR
jgi:Ni,Fe-hydrogenase maturation factor